MRRGNSIGDIYRRWPPSIVVVMAASALTLPASAQSPGSHRPPKTDPEMIANAMSAGPPAVSRDATIIVMDALCCTNIAPSAPTSW
jgi:hypothetical protein